MSNKIQVRRGTTAVRVTKTFDAGEPAFDTDLKRLFVGDGTTAGGVDIAPPVVSFKNKIINGNFDFWQRGTSFSANGYTADRFAYDSNGSSATVSQLVLSPDTGWGTAKFCMRVVVTSVSGASNFVRVRQVIESVRTLSNGSVAISFYASATVAGTKLGVSIDQGFGTGGSPSTDVSGSGQAVTLTTSPALYTVVFAVASLNGKTIGTSGTDGVSVNFWFDAGTSLATRAGSIGQASNTVFITRVQVEAGAVATDFEQRPAGLELSLCQRYCRKSFPQSTTPVNNTTAGVFGCSVSFSGTSTTLWLPYGTNMRVTPSVTLYSPNVGTPTNGQPSAFVLGGWVAGSAFTSGGNESGLQIVGLFTGATTIGAYYTQFNYLADAEL